jgi:hypothetical protein
MDPDPSKHKMDLDPRSQNIPYTEQPDDTYSESRIQTDPLQRHKVTHLPNSSVRVYRPEFTELVLDVLQDFLEVSHLLQGNTLLHLYTRDSIGSRIQTKKCRCALRYISNRTFQGDDRNLSRFSDFSQVYWLICYTVAWVVAIMIPLQCHKKNNLKDPSRAHVDVPNSYSYAVRIALCWSARLPPRRPRFDSRPRHVNLRTAN